jgi:acyl-CoA reductase-like NAD-dependent aldehyde dehydrogenase
MATVPVISSFLGEEKSSDAPTFEQVRPQDGQIIGRITEAGQHGVEAAVTIAAAAFAMHRASPVHQRVGWLKGAADALSQTVDEIASLICEDVGKPIRIARGEVRRGVEFLEASAATLTQLGGEVLPLDVTAAGAGHFGYTRHVPYGVVAGITPFNAPVNLLVQKVAPAIAAGNAVIAKPAPAGTRTALRLARLFQEAGWPKGLFTVLTGDKETAIALASHPTVRAVSFTGGTLAGDALARAAGAKKFVAELGSNAANVVLADADIQEAAQKIAAAAFEASGQQCISAQRVLVEKPVFDAFVQSFVAAATKLKVGRADDPSTDVGPMVSRAAAERVMAMCEEAISLGASYALPPQRTDALVSPGILLNTPRTARLWREEVFGPIAIVTPFEGVSEGLALANDSPFGLQGAVFTSNLRSAFQFSEHFDVGALWINEASRFRLDIYPFGGMKQSGVGREGLRYAIEEFSQIKFIGIRA